MAKYMLVSFKTCPWVQRSAIILREKNTAAFEFRHIEPDNRPDWFLGDLCRTKRCRSSASTTRISLFESERDQRMTSTRQSNRASIRPTPLQTRG